MGCASTGAREGKPWQEAAPLRGRKIWSRIFKTEVLSSFVGDDTAT
jgi:hypothetical protein